MNTKQNALHLNSSFKVCLLDTIVKSHTEGKAEKPFEVPARTIPQNAPTSPFFVLLEWFKDVLLATKKTTNKNQKLLPKDPKIQTAAGQSER